MTFAVVAPASAATCPAPAPLLTVQFHEYFTTANTPLTVPDTGMFTSGAMPSCAWAYTQTVNLATQQPSGTISNIHNDPSVLGTVSQGGFTFTPATGFVGTAYFFVQSFGDEFKPQFSFITVTAPSGGGGGGDPGGSIASTKDDCKGSGVGDSYQIRRKHLQEPRRLRQLHLERELKHSSHSLRPMLPLRYAL